MSVYTKFKVENRVKYNGLNKIQKCEPLIKHSSYIMKSMYFSDSVLSTLIFIITEYSNNHWIAEICNFNKSYIFKNDIWRDFSSHIWKVVAYQKMPRFKVFSIKLAIECAICKLSTIVLNFFQKKNSKGKNFRKSKGDSRNFNRFSIWKRFITHKIYVNFLA